MKTVLVLVLTIFTLCADPLIGIAAVGNVKPYRRVAQDDKEESYSADQLDNLLAPIALYPDPLLAQVLLASTFVDEVDEASRWVRANGTNSIDDESWDVSVKAVAHYPTVLSMMADQLDWTTALGQAYVNQSTDVMLSVQRLRGMAYNQGNLVTTPEQQVVVDDGSYEIWPAQDQYIYIPTYDPSVIFFRRAYFNGGFGNYFAFSTGFFIGSWLNNDFDWHRHNIFYHGWQGGGWIARSRPRVRLTNVYVNNRYRNITFNRGVTSRSVNYSSINRFHGIHSGTNFENRGQNRSYTNTNTKVNNTTINRNINTNDPNLDKHRGRDNQTRPTTTTNSTTTTTTTIDKGKPKDNTFTKKGGQTNTGTTGQPGTSGGLSKGNSNFDPRASSQRGQESRRDMNKTQTVNRTNTTNNSSNKSSPKTSNQGSRSSGKHP